MAVTPQEIDFLVNNGKITPEEGERLKRRFLFNDGMGLPKPEFATRFNDEQTPTAPVSAPVSAGGITPDKREEARKDLRSVLAPIGMLPSTGIAARVQKILGNKESVKQIGDRLSVGDVGGAASAVVEANKTASAPPPDQKAPGEGGEVTDDIPGDDAAAQAAAAEAAQQSAYQAGVNAYNKKLDDWKKNTEKKFEDTVGKANSEQQQLMDERGDILERQGDEASKFLSMESMIRYNTSVRDEQEAAKDRAILENKLKEADRINDELMNSKIDEGRWFSKVGEGGGALGFLQKLTFAVGSILTGGAARRNVVQNLIDQDIKLQQEQYERKAAGLKNKHSLYGQYYQLFQDKDKARAATRASLMQLAAGQLDAMAARHGGEVAKNNASIAKTKLEQEIQGARFNLYTGLNPAPARPGGGGASALPNVQGGLLVTTPDGVSFYANTEKEAQDLRDAGAGLEALERKLDRLEVLNANPRTYIPGTDENREWDQISKGAQLDYTAVHKGNNSEPDAVRVEKALGIPSQYSVDTAKTLHRLRLEGRAVYKSGVRRSRGTVVRTGFAPNKNGVLERKAIPTGQTTAGYGSGTGQVANGDGAPPVPGAKKN